MCRERDLSVKWLRPPHRIHSDHRADKTWTLRNKRTLPHLFIDKAPWQSHLLTQLHNVQQLGRSLTVLHWHFSQAGRYMTYVAWDMSLSRTYIIIIFIHILDIWGQVYMKLIFVYVHIWKTIMINMNICAVNNISDVFIPTTYMSVCLWYQYINRFCGGHTDR